MLRKVIKTILFLPLFLCLHSVNLIASDAKDYLDNVLEEEADNLFISYEDIDSIVLNNSELKSLQNLITSASFNLSSQIAKKYPSLDLQANGLPNMSQEKVTIVIQKL